MVHLNGFQLGSPKHASSHVRPAAGSPPSLTSITYNVPILGPYNDDNGTTTKTIGDNNDGNSNRGTCMNGTRNTLVFMIVRMGILVGMAIEKPQMS